MFLFSLFARIPLGFFTEREQHVKEEYLHTAETVQQCRKVSSRMLLQTCFQHPRKRIDRNWRI